MKTKRILAAVLILIAGTLSKNSLPVFALENAGNFQVFTIDESVQIALENNLSLQRSAMGVATTKRAANRSWNGLLPTVSASALVSHPTSITDPIPPGRDVWTPGFQINAGLNLSTAVIENVRKAQADYEAGVLTYEAAKQELELQVRKLFYQILLLDANRELAIQNLTSAQARYEQSAALARVGQTSRLDELSARVDMENQRPAVRNAEIIYENALDSFKMVLGLPSDVVIKLDGNLAILPIGELSITNTQSSELSVRQSLETARLLQSIRSMEAQRNAVRNQAYIPSLNLAWSSMPMYGLNPLNSERQWGDNTGSFSVSLRFNIDNFLFFPWSPAKTQIDTLNDNIRSAEIQLSETIRNRENRVNQNIRTIERILESLEAMKFNVELAESTYAQFEDAYRRGAADYQRVRSAGDSLEQAKNRLLQEQYNLIAALLDLEKESNVPFGTLSK